MCRAGCTCIFLSYTHLAHLVCYFPYYIGKLTAHYCIALHLHPHHYSLSRVCAAPFRVPCPHAFAGKSAPANLCQFLYPELLPCPQKEKVCLCLLWVFALAALSAVVSITHYIYPILSTPYLFPTHNKKEAESIICSRPLAVLSLFHQESGYPKIP